MSGSKQGLRYLVWTIVLASASLQSWGDEKSNPYDVIVDRNPFQLKPPPPPVDPNATPVTPPAPPATVELTGITSILSSKRALFEIIPGPGKQMIKPILAEGERVESVEVVSIDVEKNEVTIKNGTLVTNLTFKVAKATPSGPVPPGAIVAPATPSVIAQPSQPLTINQAPTLTGRNNVIVAGGSSSAPTPSVAPAAPNFGSPIATPTPPPALGGSDAGFRQIPSRTIRPTATPQGVTAPMASREEQTIGIELQRELNNQINQRGGRQIPELPPTQLSRDQLSREFLNFPGAQPSNARP